MASLLDDDEDPEIVLLNKPDAKVYPVPPATSGDGHRAGDWKEALQAVSVRVVGKGKDLYIRLYNRDSEKGLFVQCVIPNGEHEKWCEAVVDSSRYWVLKVVHGARHAFLGFGFSDRNDAFDFKCCLTDFRSQFVQRDVDAAENIAAPLKDLSLKDGEKIQVNLPGLSANRRSRADSGSTSTSASSALGGLAPPPPAGGGGLLSKPPAPAASLAAAPPAAAAPFSTATTANAAADAAFADFADFDDFQSAAPA
mmetsp:Transcript_23381/g.51353  ORF Transcript_23381/g.51353 Transcript_23381/m.51353 type:complete len:253 (-) Transcript_23381:149-907(-)|eukprot:CAMPEP_0206477820 /NCGR_PEP_ID=MMETSP0324_2-20121206/35656_1 /ASSEMBLY_ACC=CAM_ASM_000836 /TAXON_ID=2866 /ORGANISM="Crypthecodinium cohnii, Strain Seligo" /LENGTH=252 /DNA_ID=CAMNT_0053953949 /DNA_START=28 /DNA_END=786 /DNA_ORIENTATION=-